jgi:hypothetical protein
MPKKKDPPLSAAEQKRRFEALAREVGARQSAEELRKNLRQVATSVTGRQGVKKK